MLHHFLVRCCMPPDTVTTLLSFASPLLLYLATGALKRSGSIITPVFLRTAGLVRFLKELSGTYCLPRGWRMLLSYTCSVAVSEGHSVTAPMVY